MPKEETEFDPRSGNVAQRMNWIMQQIDYVQKDKKDEMKYTIVSHDKVTELVRPYTVRAGILYYPLGGTLQINVNGNRTEATFEMRFENIDDRTDYIDVATMGFGVDSQDKGPGKAISYGVKYALLKALGLATGDDPDMNQGREAEHRSTLDQRAEELEQLIETSPDSNALKATMNSAPTQEIMGALQARNPGEFNRMRAIMSRKSKALKEAEAVDQRPAEERDEGGA